MCRKLVLSLNTSLFEVEDWMPEWDNVENIHYLKFINKITCAGKQNV